MLKSKHAQTASKAQWGQIHYEVSSSEIKFGIQKFKMDCLKALFPLCKGKNHAKGSIMPWGPSIYMTSPFLWLG